MSTSIYIDIPNEKDKRVKKFIKQFCKYHNKKRHGKEKDAMHSARVINNLNEDPFIAIPTHYSEDNHTIKTLADIFIFLEENPEVAEIWEDKIEVSGDFC